MRVYIHTDGTISTMTEEELIAIPEYHCEECGGLFRTTTDRRTCDPCMQKSLNDSLFPLKI